MYFFILQLKNSKSRDHFIAAQRQINEILQWMMTTFMFNFAVKKLTVTNFNIRVASDVIHRGNKTLVFLRDLSDRISNIHIDRLNETLSTVPEVLELQLDSIDKLKFCSESMPVLRTDLVAFTESVIQNNFLKYHDHFVRDENFFR